MDHVSQSGITSHRVRRLLQRIMTLSAPGTRPATAAVRQARCETEQTATPSTAISANSVGPEFDAPRSVVSGDPISTWATKLAVVSASTQTVSAATGAPKASGNQNRADHRKCGSSGDVAELAERVGFELLWVL
jgi:hypothetical protein